MSDRSAVSLAFPMVSGTPSLNFVATVGKRFSDQIERLREPDDLARWLVAAGLWDRARAVSESDLAAARRLREAIFRCVQAIAEGRALPDRDLATINKWAVRPMRSPQLLRWGVVVWSGLTARHALAELARNAALILGRDVRARLRRCAGADCSIYFVDDSRTGRRCWCSMMTCGNRAKVMRFRRRSM